MALSTLSSAGRATKSVDGQALSGTMDWRGVLFRVLLLSSLLLTLLIIVVLLVDVVGDGSDVLTSRLSDFLHGTLRSRSSDEKLGLFQGLRGSVWIAIFVIGLAFPIGIGAAIYLEEYAPANRLTHFIELNIRNLAGVPSVVYGLLGLTLFLNLFKRVTQGDTLVSAGITLAILVLPVVIITSSEAIRAVPNALREGGYGVGATQWEVIRYHVLPYAAPGILTGTLLSLSRAIGEAAPLILIGAITGRLGSSPGLADVGALREKFTALPIVITSWVQKSNGAQDDGVEGMGFAAHAAAAIVVLMVFVLLLNSVAIYLRNRFEKQRG